MTTAPTTFYGTSVGKKVVMAVSGFIVFGFVVVHMLGNLQIFLGPEKLNTYAHFLQSLGAFKWAFRAVVALAALLHMWAAIQVTLQSWAARPHKYARQRYRETTYAARTMWIGGPIILLFLIYHLLHFTTGHAHHDPAGFEATFALADGEKVPNVFNNVVHGFQIWWVSAIYIVTMFLVGLHLYHGVWSMLQTVGAAHPGYNKWRRVFSVLFGLFVAAAGISMPVAVLIGYIQPV